MSRVCCLGVNIAVRLIVFRPVYKLLRFANDFQLIWILFVPRLLKALFLLHSRHANNGNQLHSKSSASVQQQWQLQPRSQVSTSQVVQLRARSLLFLVRLGWFFFRPAFRIFVRGGNCESFARFLLNVASYRCASCIDVVCIGRTA